MNRAESQFILTAYRPNGADALDPEFADALRRAEADPELGEWFAQEQAMDRFVADKLRETPLPASLRDRILAGARVSRKPAWFGAAKWMSLVAAVLVFSILGSYYLHISSRNKLATFAMNFIGQDFEWLHESGEMDKIKTWLAAQHAPVPQSLPARLAGLEKIGCRTIDYQGRSISMICFFNGDKGYHLFVMKRLREPLFVSLSGRQIRSVGKYSAAAWSDNENDYVLATEEGMPSLERLL